MREWEWEWEWFDWSLESTIGFDVKLYYLWSVFEYDNNINNDNYRVSSGVSDVELRLQTIRSSKNKLLVKLIFWIWLTGAFIERFRANNTKVIIIIIPLLWFKLWIW